MNKLLVVGALLVASLVASAAERELSLADYREKMKAAWMGHIIGMSYGSPMKWDAFKPGEVIPVEKMNAQVAAASDHARSLLPSANDVCADA